ncbi:MAG: N-acetyltransferase [Winogradskyella sp.]|nr:N-acetyltransferase [Winogradskyella sp.]
MMIQQKDNGKRGEFYLEIDTKIMASMTYSYAGEDKIIIDHTDVDESLKGQGVGYKLVEASVDFARKNNIKIMPLCPFANSVFKKRSEYKDVLL